MDRGINISKKRIVLVVFNILVATTSIVLFSFKLYEEYMAKDLDELLNYNEAELNWLDFYTSGEDNWRTDQSKNVDEILEFLGKYKVKKLYRDWDAPEGNGGTSFYIKIYTNEEIKSVSIFENRLYFSGYVGTGVYRVLNGPIDLEWLQDYYEKNLLLKVDTDR